MTRSRPSQSRASSEARKAPRILPRAAHQSHRLAYRPWPRRRRRPQTGGQHQGARSRDSTATCAPRIPCSTSFSSMAISAAGVRSCTSGAHRRRRAAATGTAYGLGPTHHRNPLRCGHSAALALFHVKLQWPRRSRRGHSGIPLNDGAMKLSHPRRRRRIVVGSTPLTVVPERISGSLALKERSVLRAGSIS